MKQQKRQLYHFVICQRSARAVSEDSSSRRTFGLRSRWFPKFTRMQSQRFSDRIRMQYLHFLKWIAGGGMGRGKADTSGLVGDEGEKDL